LAGQLRIFLFKVQLGEMPGCLPVARFFYFNYIRFRTLIKAN
jgi:hypothetical protein